MNTLQSARTGTAGGGSRAIAPQTAHMLTRAGCQWLTAAAEMAALVSGRWPAAPDTTGLRWATFPGTGRRGGGLDAGSVRAARHFTVAIVRRWNAADRCADVAIVVSELLSNALQHAPAGPGRARWPVRLGLLQCGHCLLCAVADPGQATPAARQPGRFGETGRGLGVVAALSDRWGYTVPCDSGKVTWALFSTPAAPGSLARSGPRTSSVPPPIPAASCAPGAT